MASINIKPQGTKGAFNAYGGNLEFLEATDHQVFLYGGTGSGKTFTACNKLLVLLLLYPGAKALFTRNSYRALIKSGVETFENVCRMHGLSFGKGADQIRKLGETEPREYQFPYRKRVGMKDGKPHVYEGVSRIVLSSLSKAKEELGSEYDYVYVNQPEQATEDDWQFLVTRANGRRDHVPTPMLWGDPNPEHDRHWIKINGYQIVDGKKVGDGDRWRLIKSTYKDNPMIWDHKLNCYTKNGEEQMSRLRTSLNTVMTERLINGEWCSFEGLVFGDVWDRKVHLRPRSEFDITDQWERYWAIDFGFDSPCCVMFFAKNPYKEQYVCYKYIYETGQTIYQTIDRIKSLTANEPRPKVFVADRSPEPIMILTQELGINVISAKKGAGSVKAGVSILADMLKNQELIILEDSCVSDDERLRYEKHPIGLEEEIENYRLDPNKPDHPIQEQDHALDATRYLFTFIRANKRIVPFIWE